MSTTNEIDALKRSRREIGDEIKRLADMDELTPGQQERFDRQTVAFDKLTADISKAELREKIATDPNIRIVPGDARSADDDMPRGRGQGLQLRRRVADPWVERSRYDDPMVVRDRALTTLDEDVSPGHADDGIACEPEDRARIEALLRSEAANGRGSDVADYTIAASRPAYERAFTKAVRGQTAYWTDEEKDAVIELDRTRVREEARMSRDASDQWESRAALSTTGANGGFMIPFFLDPTIILSNAGAQNPMRRVARVITIPTNVWHGVSSAGVTAEWTGEATEVTDASPTFSQPTITPIRADAYVQASFEVVADSNVAAQIGMLFADAKDRLEVAAHFQGTGSTQPEGIVTRLSVTTNSKVSSQTNGSFGAVDVFSLAQALPARWQNNASWATNYTFEYSIRQFANAASPLSSTFWVDLGGDNPSRLLGKPINPNSGMMATPLSTATASSDYPLVIGDFNQYAIVDRLGMEIVVNPLVLGSSHRPTGEIGWLGVWRTGADTLVSDAFRMLVC